ncbi:phosphatidylinositol mannoside acyltransferase [Corynebacterium sp. 153RC1]|uniref:phosphatidylinositol mannoside acyltransferase n=1 Tax=unclassified Corynebacterium TaxID=2624378 RepID=UPI00211C2BB6|nr:MULTISPECIES: phosphatidylinositol mannoside acyltransferase [unclassified Corynebacterium]MCQ9369645.1 phosphatidylinositol mannoside acyltransferase [Corynebacterium sp. 35RC1]MCQ9351509.1 phosphatidylinositol mannoside acyltransferase [Corynebacterium sp. 209RC1]MCQ9354638.1 phosphatidylinositol mannoside acyltransferase [Corynebacterium sp. 1222RC1]MCQ9357510.1 phosphatidylinositol mannoside acyltransferase [Corynebacterium sp. 122RC1]MCQ9358036.1 phosphatidylinositol mannoside acyltran
MAKFPLGAPTQVRQELAAQAYLLGWRLVRALPLPVAEKLFQFGADLASGNGRKLPQLRKNLARVVGSDQVNDALVQASMRSYARYWLEAFRLPSMVHSPKAYARVTSKLSQVVQGEQYLRDSFAQGKGVVLVLPHSGNWDMAGVYLVHELGTFSTVAERLQPERLYQAFVDFRESLGFEVLPHTGGVVRPFDVLRQRLREGKVVCLLGERDLKATGHEVEFFGETARMPVGAVKLAQETGAALHVVHCWFEPDGWGFSISEQVPTAEGEQGLESAMRQVAHIMESNIAAHPEDWHMLQPLWIADLDSRRYARGLKRDAE